MKVWKIGVALCLLGVAMTVIGMSAKSGGNYGLSSAMQLSAGFPFLAGLATLAYSGFRAVRGRSAAK